MMGIPLHNWHVVQYQYLKFKLFSDYAMKMHSDFYREFTAGLEA